MGFPGKDTGVGCQHILVIRQMKSLLSINLWMNSVWNIILKSPILSVPHCSETCPLLSLLPIVNVSPAWPLGEFSTSFTSQLKCQLQQRSFSDFSRQACRFLPLSSQPGFPGGASGKEPASQCRSHKRCKFDLGLEEPLEEGMATHSSILAWRIPRTGEPGGATVHRAAKRQT